MALSPSARLPRQASDQVRSLVLTEPGLEKVVEVVPASFTQSSAPLAVATTVDEPRVFCAQLPPQP